MYVFSSNFPLLSHFLKTTKNGFIKMKMRSHHWLYFKILVTEKFVKIFIVFEKYVLHHRYHFSLSLLPWASLSLSVEISFRYSLPYTAESSLLDFGFSLICLDFYSLCRFLITFMISVFILNHTLVLTSSTLVYFKTIIACA